MIPCRPTYQLMAAAPPFTSGCFLMSFFCCSSQTNHEHYLTSLSTRQQWFDGTYLFDIQVGDRVVYACGLGDSVILRAFVW